MKRVIWKAAGLAALVTLLGSNACRAADVLFSEAASTCVGNHADPEKVLSTADARGWYSLSLGQLMQTTGLRPNPHVRVKDIEGGVAFVKGSWLYLKVDESIQSGATVRSCSIVGNNLSWADTLEAAQSYLGVPPSQENAQVVQWVYVERDGQRLYFRGDQLKHVKELADGATLHALSIVHDPAQASPPAVMYKEVAAEP
jgi:hypothetical protein